MKRVVKVLAGAPMVKDTEWGPNDTYYLKVGTLVYPYYNGAIDLMLPVINLRGIARFNPWIREIKEDEKVPEEVIKKSQKIVDENEDLLHQNEAYYSPLVERMLIEDPDFPNYY